MTNQTRNEILSSLQGQTVNIPDLHAIYAHFPFLVNPNQDTITTTVHTILSTYSMTAGVETKLKRANLALLIASWYPFSSAETLREITYFVCWMYMIDDAIIDKVSWPGLDNAAAFEAAHDEIMDFVYKSLKLDGDENKEQSKSKVDAIDSFRHIGETLCLKYSLRQRRRFYESCKLTMDGYRTEQRLRVSGRLPTWNEYWLYREGSSCIGMCVAMIELAIGSHLPDEILESEEIKVLWEETVVGAWIVNDIVSVKKELGEGFVENAVALGALKTMCVQDGMDRAVQPANKSVERFEEQARNIEARISDIDEQGEKVIMNQTLRDEVRRFVESCKCILTGSLSWSLVSARYGLHLLPRDMEGNMTFVVGQ